MKYGSTICQIPNCPPISAAGRKVIAYRFVFDPLEQGSFLPQAVKNPSRMDSADTAEVQCSLMALSFFTTREFAEKKFKNLSKMGRNLRKTLGSHIAEGILEPADGL